jgi:hypothetical protein
MEEIRTDRDATRQQRRGRRRGGNPAETPYRHIRHFTDIRTMIAAPERAVDRELSPIIDVLLWLGCAPIATIGKYR